MNVSDAATQLNLSTSTLYARLRSGAIAGEKRGRRWAISPGAVSAAARAPRTGHEAGFHGTTVWDGLVKDDYNDKLQWPTSIETYDKMRKSDGQVQAIETVVSLPVRTVRYYIEPGDDSKAAQAAAELIERNLLDGDGMSMTFDDLIRKALVSVIMGYQVFEKVYTELDGHIIFRKFADRHPRTIGKWTFDNQGGIAGIIQEGLDASGKRREEAIPIDKLLRFTYREEWGNPEGFPLARVMYKHWYIKDSLYKIANIGAERDWVGTPVGKAPQGATNEDREAFVEILEKLTTHEGSAITLPFGWEMEAYAGHTRTDALMQYIDHHDAAMAMAALAGFIRLPSQKTGSRALSSDQSQFFLLCEEALANWICSVINQYAIRPLIEWNFPGLAAIPTLQHAHIGTVLQPVQIAHALAALVNKELLTVDDDIQNAVRDMMNLPEIPEGQARKTVPDDDVEPPAPSAHTVAAGLQPAAVPSVAAGLQPAPVPSVAAGLQPAAVPSVAAGLQPAAVQAADPTPAMLRQDIERIRGDLDGAHDELVESGRVLLDRAFQAFGENAAHIMDSFPTMDDQACAGIHRALADLELPYTEEYRQWLNDLLLEVVTAGFASAADDTFGDPDAKAPDLPAELSAFVATQAAILAHKHYADLKFAAVARIQRDLDAKLGRDAAMFNVRQELRERATANFNVSLSDAIKAITDQVSGVLAAATPVV